MMLLVLLFALVTVSLACDPQTDPNYYNRDGYRRGYYNPQENYENRGYYRDGRYYNNYNNNYNNYNNREINREYYSQDEVVAEQKDPCATPKAVAEFNKYFAEEVKKCALLTDVFNGGNNVTREEFKAAVFYVVSILGERSGIEKPTPQALTSIKNIVPNCEKISPDLLISIYSNAAAKRAYEQNKLCSSNAQILAQTYARSTKDMARRIVGEKCPRSKMTAIIRGLADFLDRQVLHYRLDDVDRTSIVYSNEWKCEDKNAKPQKCAIANYSPAKPALKECDNVCKIQDKAIDIFVSEFSRQVKECKILQNMFNLQNAVSPAMFSRGTYYIDILMNNEYYAPNPRDGSDFQSRFIRDAKSLDAALLERVHSTFLGKYLVSVKALNTKNAAKLALMLANIGKVKAETFVDNKFPRTKVVAIQTFWRNFLFAINLITAESNAKISYYYGNEWRCQLAQA